MSLPPVDPSPDVVNRRHGDRTEDDMTSRCPNGHDIPDGNAYCGTCGLAAATPPVIDAVCANDHVLPDGNTYCGICGSGAKPIQAPLPLCPNGHAVQPEMIFCEECGTAIATPQALLEGVTSSAPGGIPVQPEAPFSTATTAEPDNSKKVLGLMGGVLLLIVVVLVVANVNSANKHVAGADPTPTPNISLTRHEVCVNQLTQLLYDGTRGKVVWSLNGMQDPFYVEGQILNQQFQSDVAYYGKSAGQSKLDQSISNWCAQRNDPRRNNVDDYGNPT